MIIILFHSTDRERVARALVHDGDLASARRRANRERGPFETLTAVGTRSEILPLV